MSEKIAPADRAERGPFDVAEVGQLTPYLDFGSIRISPRNDIKLRVEVEEASKRLVAITIQLGESLLQLQAFAAPKSSGLWDEVRPNLVQSLNKQNAEVSERVGLIGPELRAEVPVEGKGVRKTIFVGVDGPRWLLRGVISGAACDQIGPYQELIDVFRSVVVSRGETPLPPSELLPLKIPEKQQDANE